MDGPIIEKQTPIETHINVFILQHPRSNHDVGNITQYAGRDNVTSGTCPNIPNTYNKPPKNTCFINRLIYNSPTVTNVNINNVNDNTRYYKISHYPLFTLKVDHNFILLFQITRLTLWLSTKKSLMLTQSSLRVTQSSPKILKTIYR